MTKIPYPIRLEQSLLWRIKRFAQHQGRSVNNFIVETLKKATSGKLPKIEPELDNEFCQEPDKKLNTITDANRT